MREDHQFVEPFTSMNPFHCVPFLALDNGTVIAESVSICRYLEELHPEPALFGGTAEERARVDMWQRRFELDGFMPLLHAVRNHVPMFAGRVVPGTRTDLPQLPELVNRGREMTEVFLGGSSRTWPGTNSSPGRTSVSRTSPGSSPCAWRPCWGMDIGASWPAVAAWFARVSARPAFQL